MNLTQAWKLVGEGEELRLRPRGNSMAGLVDSGALVRVAPCDSSKLEPGDIVLVRVKGSVYLHLVKARNNGRLLIGNNRGGTNGWCQEEKATGICVEVDGKARPNVEGKLR